MSKIKTKIVRLVETHYDKYEEWDKEHKYPKVERPWEERVAPDVWHPYNDTYGKPPMGETTPGSFAEFCDKNRGGDPGFMYMIDGSMLETIDSTIDRMSCKCVGTCTASWHDVGEKMYEVYESVKEPGLAASAVFSDPANPKHVFEFTVIGSADFFDLDGPSKEFMSEKWYRRWYDENSARGLVEFPYSFRIPERVKTNAEAFADATAAEMLKAFGARRDPGQTMESWLESPAGA